MSNLQLLRRELAILRDQRASLPPHRRSDYQAEQRLAILQIRRLRHWIIPKTARRTIGSAVENNHHIDMVPFGIQNPSMKARIRAIGFDLGETLLFYRDTPLNWASCYPAALACVAAAGGAKPRDEELAAAAGILSRYNTRIVPRTDEVPAEVILSAVLGVLGVAELSCLPKAIEAFFGFFQQRICTYPE